eukprot:m.43692 g.43692  ORF g.43692 m.43692 type:complete len:210 (-) comp10566_c2_seq2:111-740(-)
MDYFKEIGEFFGESGGEVADFASSLVDMGIDGISKQDMQLLSETVYELTKLEKKNAVRRGVFADVENKLRCGAISNDAELMDMVEEKCTAQKAAWSDKTIEDNPQYRRAKDAQTTLFGDEDAANDNDLMISQTQADVSRRCPITTKEFKNPIQSKLCGHTFEGSAVNSILKKKRIFKCPVQGCKHGKHALTSMNEFRLDKRMKRLLNLD